MFVGSEGGGVEGDRYRCWASLHAGKCIATARHVGLSSRPGFPLCQQHRPITSRQLTYRNSDQYRSIQFRDNPHRLFHGFVVEEFSVRGHETSGHGGWQRPIVVPTLVEAQTVDVFGFGAARRTPADAEAQGDEACACMPTGDTNRLRMNRRGIRKRAFCRPCCYGWVC